MTTPSDPPLGPGQSTGGRKDRGAPEGAGQFESHDHPAQAKAAHQQRGSGVEQQAHQLPNISAAKHLSCQTAVQPADPQPH